LKPTIADSDGTVKELFLELLGLNSSVVPRQCLTCHQIYPADLAACRICGTPNQEVIPVIVAGTLSKEIKQKVTRKKPAAEEKSMAELGREHMGGKGPPRIDELPPATVNGHRSRDIPGELLQVKPEQILPSPTNPRRHFDHGKLQALGDGFKKVGILSPIIIRKAPIDADQPYELIAGERRWRAACHVFLKAIPARLVEVTDEEALEIQAAENLDREELNPIERADQFRILIEQGGYTQESLGKRFNVSQGEVSNSIRLLKLPAFWQELVVGGDLTPTHVRHLIAWVDYPAIMQKCQEDIRDREFPITSEDFEELVDDVVFENSRSMDSRDWDPASRQFKPTPEQLEKLDVKEYSGGYHRNSKRAMNVVLWDELQAAAIQKKQKRMSSKVGKDDEAPVETAAQLKEKAKKLADQFAKRLYKWKLAWLQKICADRLSAADDATVLRWLLFYSVQWEARGREDSFASACKSLGSKGKRDLGKLTGEQLGTLARAALQSWVQHEIDNYHAGIQPEDVERLAAEFKIDVAKEWKLTQEFLELHTKSQLVDLVKDIAPKVSIPETENRKNAISRILAEAGNKCPTSILKCKSVKLS